MNAIARRIRKHIVSMCLWKQNELLATQLHQYHPVTTVADTHVSKQRIRNDKVKNK